MNLGKGLFESEKEETNAMSMAAVGMTAIICLCVWLCTCATSCSSPSYVHDLEEHIKAHHGSGPCTLTGAHPPR